MRSFLSALVVPVLLILFVTACGAPAGAPEVKGAPDVKGSPGAPAAAAAASPGGSASADALARGEAQEGVVSPPVTLEAFRAAFPVGTKIRLSFAEKGKPVEEQRWTWVKADKEGCEIATTVHDASGKLLRDEGSSPATWAELLSHGRFPAAKTERSDSSIEVPAGRFETWLFTVRDVGKDGTPMVKRYHFAKSMPGPPVLFTIESAGGEVFRMTMLERTAP
jgi:hypothetical protein